VRLMPPGKPQLAHPVSPCLFPGGLGQETLVASTQVSIAMAESWLRGSVHLDRS